MSNNDAHSFPSSVTSLAHWPAVPSSKFAPSVDMIPTDCPGLTSLSICEGKGRYPEKKSASFWRLVFWTPLCLPVRPHKLKQMPLFDRKARLDLQCHFRDPLLGKPRVWPYPKWVQSDIHAHIRSIGSHFLTAGLLEAPVSDHTQNGYGWSPEREKPK